MRIVIDTNVLISGVFFGGFPREILRAVVDQKITACATTEIINETFMRPQATAPPRIKVWGRTWNT